MGPCTRTGSSGRRSCPGSGSCTGRAAARTIRTPSRRRSPSRIATAARRSPSGRSSRRRRSGITSWSTTALWKAPGRRSSGWTATSPSSRRHAPDSREGALASACRGAAGALTATSALAHLLPAALGCRHTVHPNSPRGAVVRPRRPCGALPSERAGSSPKEAIMSTSRRDFLATSLAGLVSAAFARPGLARVLLRPGQEPVFTPIRRNVGYFTMRGGTIGYLVNGDGVVVVDTQFPASAEAFLEGLSTRSRGRRVDVLLNTHHHGDHTGGNSVSRGVARHVVAHEKAAEHLRQPAAGGEAPADQFFQDTVCTEGGSADVVEERIGARYYGRAHTSGDAVITVERAIVAHMGDLMFHRRHPVVDRAAGATIRNWMTVLERALQDHANDTVYIFGHASTGLPVVGGRAELERFHDYFEALLTFVEAQIRAGRSRDEILAMPGPLEGFEAYGPFGRQSPRSALTCAYEEVVEGVASRAGLCGERAARGLSRRFVFQVGTRRSRRAGPAPVPSCPFPLSDPRHIFVDRHPLPSPRGPVPPRHAEIKEERCRRRARLGLPARRRETEKQPARGA